VDGLEARYGDEIAFVRLDAADGAAGQQAFASLALPGHPSVVLFDADGRERFRSFGLIGEPDLEAAVQALFAPAER
jgi:hypothetical protein